MKKVLWFMIFPSQSDKVMFNGMPGSRCNLKIFNPVVLLIFNGSNGKFNSFMMDKLKRLKVSAKVLFHNKAMFKNPAIRSCKGVRGQGDRNISFFKTFFVLKIVGFSIQGTTFLRTKIYSINNTLFSKKIFSASYTLFPPMRSLKLTFRRAIFESIDITFRNIDRFFTNIALLMNSSFRFPRPSFFSNIRTFFRTTKIFMKMAWFDVKFFFTNFAKFNHNLSFFLMIVILLGILSSPVFAANEWRDGSGKESVTGDTNVSSLDEGIFQEIVDPLDTLLNEHHHRAALAYNSAATVDISAGEIACKNSTGTIVRMRQNTSTLNVTFSDIDTGAEASGTTYYVYGSCDADATTFVAVISANSSTPTGITYYKKIGSFHNNSSSDIERYKVYQTPFGAVPTDSSGIPPITAIFDYGTSVSSFTAKTADLKFAFGRVTLGGFGATTVTNLPFTTSSSFRCWVTYTATETSFNENTAIFPVTASSATISNGSGGTRTLDWGCVGF